MNQPRLRVRDGQGRRVVAIDKPIYTIGRRSSSDLQIVSPDVSRDHAEITRAADRYVIHDRGSQYGTFVNGETVTERPLEHGDRVRLGRSDAVELVFLTDGVDSGVSDTASGVTDLRQVAALLDSLRALGSGKALDEVLTLVMDAAIDVSDADRGFIMLADAHGELEFKIARTKGGVTLPGNTFATSIKIPREVFATGRTFDDRFEGELANVHLETMALGIRHVLCAALPRVYYGNLYLPAGAAPRSKRIGVLYLDAKERSTQQSRMTRTALETFATEAGLAIESARLYTEATEKARLERELRIAAEIQRSLLPEPRYVGAGVEAAADSVPCQAIGGDFFDYLTLSDGSFGFALGDVAGKGPPAALLAAKLQGIFTAQASSSLSAAETMAGVNQALIRRAIEARFATMMYGIVSPTGTLTYCNAGHNPPFLLTRSGAVRRLDQGGLVLGLFQHAAYDEESLQLYSGDVLVVFSDGVSEALSASGEEFGEDRILTCFQPYIQDDPPALLARLLGVVHEFTKGAVQSDDVTALVLRYSGAGA
jgi:sigma-B regulation protein RsbU (phosphoserine phosphatase)